ncbi:MAG: MFS transporter [Oscillatoriales cyanobacterium RM2_1_1]|nr:MFS transporter [Oscillatoriales cyanobacterium SM2_3_0]NJO47117.1 MFS transporter [Oscillatoriales cyanobacterium RM2_1_1]
MTTATSSGTNQPLSFEQQLDQSPLTPSMWLLWGLSAGLIALDGFDFFIIGVALPFLQRDFNLNSTEVGAIAVAAVAGSLVGSLTLGPVTDKIGRQIMLIVDVVIFLVATAGTALAWNAISLICFRFLVGIGIGADYPISVSYITENVPARLRGRMVIGAFTFQAIGALVGALTGLTTIHIFETLYPDNAQPAIQYAWRCMLGVGFILAIVVAVIRTRFQLESPRYHISRGEYKEASACASQLLDQPVEITPESDPPPETATLNYGSLFAPEYRRRTILASLPWFLQDIATYGIGIFTPVIIGAIAFTHKTDLMEREMASAQGSAFVDIFLIVGFLIAIALIEKLGRIRLQISGFLGMAIGLSVLGIASVLSNSGQPNIALTFAGFLIFNLMMNAGPNATTFLLSGEVFPTAIRASGAGFAAAFAKAGAVLGTFVLPILQKSWGVPNLMFILAVICIVAATMTYLFQIETRGRSLDAIEDQILGEPELQPKLDLPT